MRLLVLLLLTAGLYAGVWSHELVYEDVQTIQSQDGLGTVTSGWMMPSRILSATSIYLVAKLDPTPRLQHLVNVALHLVNGILVFWLASLLFRDDSAALLVAALFLLHPIQSEAVNYISARSDLLAATCLLWATVCVVSEEWVLCAAFFVFAMMSKESAVVGVLLLPMTIWWFLPRRVQPWLVWGGMAAVGVTLAVKTWAILADPYVWSSASPGTSFLSFWRLIGLVLVPVGFSIEHEYSRVPKWIAVAGALILVTTARRWWLARTAHPIASFGAAWMIVALLPRFVLALPEPINEHQFYLSFFGICLIAGDLMRYSAADRELIQDAQCRSGA